MALCILFSACWKARLAGPSRTSAVTSSPRCAGRSCRKTALGLSSHSASPTWNGAKRSRQWGSGLFVPVVCQRVV